MTLIKIEGTQVRGGVYHLNLRIPADAAAYYPGKTHIRRSLKTADRKTADDAVILAKGELINAVARARQGETLKEAVAALPADQRAVYEEAGGLSGLLSSFTRSDTARAFLMAGGGVTDAELRGEVPSRTERKLAEAHLKTDLDFLAATTATTAKTLKALGQPVVASATFGLRELSKAYVEAKGTGGQTADAMMGIVERFIELHGDVELTDLTIAHLRDYSEAIRHLPAVTAAKKMRGMELPELIQMAKVKGLTAIGDKTRARHVAMLKALTSWAPSQGYLTADPWDAYKLSVQRGKHSAQKPRAPFSAAQAEAILDEAKTYPVEAIDRWAPMLAAYQGARQEEIGQLRVADIHQVGEVWAMRITDEGDGQKVKNAASFRTIPLHQKVLDAGFVAFAKTRPADGFLFMEKPRWGDMRDVEPDKRGRVAAAYQKRFGKKLRDKLKIADPRVTFHSFRHTWEDAAENTDMPQTHRRDLAGRTKAGDSQAGYGDGPKLSAMKVSLDKIDPLAN